MSKTKVTEVPYKDGSLMSYAGSYSTGVEWRKNLPFYRTLFYKTYERGVSAARFIWKDDEGHTYPMFMTDMDALLTEGEVRSAAFSNIRGPSRISGNWIVTKRGQNYGIKRVND